MSTISSTFRQAKARLDLLFPPIPSSTGGAQERAGIIAHLLRDDRESGRFMIASKRANQRAIVYNDGGLSTKKVLKEIRNLILPKVPK